VEGKGRVQGEGGGKKGGPLYYFGMLEKEKKGGGGKRKKKEHDWAIVVLEPDLARRWGGGKLQRARPMPEANIFAQRVLGKREGQKGNKAIRVLPPWPLPPKALMKRDRRTHLGSEVSISGFRMWTGKGGERK